MSDHVYKSIEITGSSPDGVTQAIERAVVKASQSLRGLDWFEVTEIRGNIEESNIAHTKSRSRLDSASRTESDRAACRRGGISQRSRNGAHPEPVDGDIGRMGLGGAVGMNLDRAGLVFIDAGAADERHFRRTSGLHGGGLARHEGSSVCACRGRRLRREEKRRQKGGRRKHQTGLR